MVNPPKALRAQYSAFAHTKEEFGSLWGCLYCIGYPGLCTRACKPVLSNSPVSIRTASVCTPHTCSISWQLHPYWGCTDTGQTQWLLGARPRVPSARLARAVLGLGSWCIMGERLCPSCDTLVDRHLLCFFNKVGGAVFQTKSSVWQRKVKPRATVFEPAGCFQLMGDKWEDGRQKDRNMQTPGIVGQLVRRSEHKLGHVNLGYISSKVGRVGCAQ